MTQSAEHHIVFLDRDTIAPFTELRRPAFPHSYEEFGQTTPDQVPERAKEATILIVNKVPLRKETLDQLPKLKMIAVAATGTDAFDTSHCAEKGIVVSNIRNYASTTVPEHTFGLILALRRNLMEYRDQVAAGEWQRAGQFCFFNRPIQDLRGSRLGIFGEGAIGQAVAEIAKGFGMIPLFAAHKGKSGLGPLYTPFDEVIETADVLTMHCPLMDETKDMIGLGEFRRMKDTAILINTARGPVIDENALVTALREEWISGAGLDVYENEPQLTPGLTECDNAVLLPHVGSATIGTRTRMAELAAHNLLAGLDGDVPPNCLNREIFDC